MGMVDNTRSIVYAPHMLMVKTEVDRLGLREIRETRGHRLSDYAERLGVDRGQLSRIERGLIGSLDVGMAWGISRVYGVPLEIWDRGVAA